MDNVIALLEAVASTMNTISVVGIDNQDKFVGCHISIQGAIRDLRAAQAQPEEKEEVTDGR